MPATDVLLRPRQLETTSYRAEVVHDFTKPLAIEDVEAGRVAARVVFRP